MPLFSRRKAEPSPDAAAGSAASALQPLLLGDLPLERWPTESSPDQGEPWESFVRARQLLAAGQRDDAIVIWRGIAAGDGLESRHVLQAWTFLRATGVAPEPATAKVALGVVVVVAVEGGHDTLAGYRDGSVRYLNHAGGASVLDSPPPDVATANAELTAAGQDLANLIGPWDQPTLPAVPTGVTRLLVLTPSGPHFGQATYEQLNADPIARPVLDAALRLVLLVVDQTTPRPNS